MELKLLPCPVCLRPHFKNADTLRSALISVSISDIGCPVCSEILRGLDKLTIHLFVHDSSSNHGHIPSTEIAGNAREEPYPTSEGTGGTPIVTPSPQDLLIDPPPEENPSRDETDQSKVKVDLEIENAKAEAIHKVADTDNRPGTVVFCDICSFPFSDETILDLHQKLLHQTSPDTVTGKYSYHCHLCSKKFKMRGSLMVHLRVAHFGFVQQTKKNAEDERSDGGGSAVSEQAKEVAKIVKRTVESVDRGKSNNNYNKQWACDVCSKMFTTKYFLKKHKRLHTGEMPYYCAQCNKYFTFQQSYHKHMLYHSDDKPHVCSECGRAFKELSTLHNHARIHSGERPFKCETCGKCFRQRVSYLVHRRIHTGAMPYKCTACEKSFRYKVSQRSHKCSSDPPGSIVRAPDLIKKLLEGTTSAQTDASSENIADAAGSHVPVNAAMSQNATASEVPSTCCIATLNENGMEEITVVNQLVAPMMILQNSQDVLACGENVRDVGSGRSRSGNYDDGDEVIAGSEPNSSSGTCSITHSENKCFSYILPPIFPKKQKTLCVQEKRDINEQNVFQDQDVTSEGTFLQTINEECFKELLYGENKP